MVVIAVVGCGLLGGRIAGELAYHGHTVRAYDKNRKTLDELFWRLEADKVQLQEDGLLLNKNFQGQVFCFSELEEALRDCQFIFEAIVEDLEAKKELFEEVTRLCLDDAVLATNTMFLDVTTIAQGAKLPERTVGLRFLYPVYSISEVEMSPGKMTSGRTITRIRGLLESMGKTVFFRSGGEPLVLSEDQVEQRKLLKQCQLRQNVCSFGDVSPRVLPTLGSSGTPTATVLDDGQASTSKEKDTDCAICMDGIRDCVLRPCNHLVTCVKCAEMLVRRYDGCPICRKDITDLIRVYHS